MSLKSACKNYDFVEKNQWGAQWWNLILRKTKGREKREAIPYLAGPDDYDRVLATRRGVPDLNLIAIDIHSANIERVKNGGNLGIVGDVYDALRSWSPRSPVCALALDFSQGFQRLKDLQRIQIAQMINPSLSGAIIALNLQRGRDEESDAERDFIGPMISRHQSLSAAEDEMARRYQELIEGIDSKHRGLMFTMWYWALGMKTILKHADRCPLTSEIIRTAGEHWLVLYVLLDCLKPRFLSYKSSGGMYYDSVVMNPLSEFFSAESSSANMRRMREFVGKGRRATALSTAAVLATRTRILRS